MLNDGLEEKIDNKGRVQSRKKKNCMEKYNLSPLKIEKISLHFWMNWAILHTLKKKVCILTYSRPHRD